MSEPDSTPPADATSSRVAIICGLLLLASAINYVDRQTLASASVRIKAEFGLYNENYGDIEAVFGYGFVLGAITLLHRISLASIKGRSQAWQESRPGSWCHPHKNFLDEWST